MNVDEAMETAKAYLVAREQMQEPLFESEEVAVTLAREVERLRAELSQCQSVLDGTRTELSICQSFHSVAKKEWQLEVEKVNRLEAELAAAKAASVPPVKFSWCYESNECDIIINGMNDEDSTLLGNWLDDRMKERGEG